MADVAGGTVRWDFDADTTKFDGKLRKASTEVDSFAKHMDSQGNTFKNFANKASASVDGVANSLGSLLTKVSLVSVAVGGFATVFVKSAADLQQTSKSFEVLTGNAQVAQKLFGQLADFAQRTPFEFPQLAKAGQTLLGFGVASDQIMNKIGILGDIAAASGANFEALALVFGQVNATGRLMGQDALQLINNKIPIFNIIGKEMGVTAGEVKKQMEQGKIGIDIFNQALTNATKEGGFAFKGVETLAVSVNGRLSTLKDTAMEFGRNLIGVKIDPALGLVIEPGGVFDKFSQMLPKITTALQEMQPRFKQAFEFLITNGDTIIALIAGLATAFVAAKLAAIGFAIAASFTNPLGWIVLAVSALAILQVKFDIFGKALKALQPVLNFLGDLFSDLFTEVKKLAQVLGDQLAPVFEFMAQHSEVLKKVLIALVAVALAPMIIAFATFVASVKVLTAILGFVASHFDTIKNVVKTALIVAFAPLIATVIVAITIFKTLVTVLTAVGNFFVSVFQKIWSVVSPILNFILDLYTIVLGLLLIATITVMTKILEFVIWAFTGVRDFIVGIWQGVRDFLAGIVTSIIDFFAPAVTWLFEHGKSIVIGLINGIKWAGGLVAGAIKEPADKIGSFFAGAGNWLYDTGKAIVQGLINGIKSMTKGVTDAAGNIADSVKNKVKNMLGIHSPSTVFMGLGKNVVQGFNEGLASQQTSLNRNMAGMLQNNLTPNITPTVSDMAIGSGAENTSIENHIGTINIGSQVDAENWLKQLTRQDEVVKTGLTI